MKKFVLLMGLCLCMNSVFGTEASKFAEEQYSKQTGNEKVHITVKKEHTVEYQQKIGEQMIPAITYGYGDMKAKKQKKCRITYICLLDENCKPIWSYIFPSK